MTHFDEMSCLLYLDGQLDSLKTKELELHVRSCAPCRSLLSALQRESALLHQAMLEEDESVPARLLAAPGREAIPWFWISSLGLAAMGALTVWTQVIQPWQDNLSQAGFGGGNLLAMLFFSGVFWKGWSEMTFLLQCLAAITLGMLFLLLLRRMRRHLRPVTLVMCGLAAMLAFPAPAAAADIVKQDWYTLPAGETLNNDLIVLGRQIEINGTVDGDVIAFGQSVRVDGQVKGDLIVFTEQLTLNGQVDGSVRGFTKSSVIPGKIGRSLILFTQQLDTSASAEIGRGLLLFGEDVALRGRIGRDAQMYAGHANVEGFIGGNFRMNGKRLRIASSAEIQGKAVYYGRGEPEVAAGAKLASALEKIIPERKPAHLTFGFYWDSVLGYASILALGTVIMLISPRGFREVTRSARRPGALMGVVAFFVVPVAACVACLTLVGFALGLVSMILWLVIIYVAQIYVGGSLGEMMLGPASSRGAAFGRLAAGLAVIRVVSALRYVLLPGAGSWILLWFVIAAWGLGAITLALYEQLRWKPLPPSPTTAPGFEPAR